MKKTKHVLERNEGKNLLSGRYRKSLKKGKSGTGGGGKLGYGKKCKLKAAALEKIIQKLDCKDPL